MQSKNYRTSAFAALAWLCIGAAGAQAGTLDASTLASLNPTVLVSNATGEEAGYLTENGTQYAFVSGANGVGAVGLNIDSDNSEMLFLNNAGDGVLEDTTNGEYYYYNSGGLYVPVSAFDLNDTSNTDQVVGLTTSGELRVMTNGVEDIIDTGNPSAVGLLLSSEASQAVDIAYTEGYTGVEAALGYSPTGAFFGDPAHAGASDFIAYDPNSTDDPVYDNFVREANGGGGGSTGAGVPEPGSLSLVGFGMLLVGRLRRKPKAEDLEGLTA